MDLEPLDPVYVHQRLAQPPFVAISGVVNVRDLGSYPTADNAQITKPRFAFRSAEIASITEEGLAQLKELGITTVFDMRSDIENDRFPCPQLEGIVVERIPVFKMEDYSPETMAKRFELYASGKTEAFMELYSQILNHGGPAFGAVLRHIRDKPRDGFVFHCTAGKDRTGVLAAIILKLVGVDDQIIAEDYALTRVGREPSRQKTMARLAQMPMFASNSEAALNMFTCRSETMIAFLGLLQDQYGGAEEYVRRFTHLTDSDIRIIRENLLVSKSKA